MSKELAADLVASIEKNLPAAIGETLRQRLEQANRDAEALARKNEAYASLSKNFDAKCEEANRLKAEVEKHAALAVREAAVEERERKARITELETKLAAAQGNTEFARNVALGLVRNIEYRSSSSVYGSESVPVQQNGYTNLQQAQTSSNNSETRSAG